VAVVRPIASSVTVVLMPTSSHEGVELTSLLLGGAPSASIPGDGRRRVQGRGPRR